MAKVCEGSTELMKWIAEQDVPDHNHLWTSAQWRSSVRKNLVRWFRNVARDLPWREHSTPYRVWVSEIMLQQTQVSTVIDYYHRFMKAYPTVVQLAEADEQEVLSLWEGLGYYRRARSMHAAAKKIVDDHEGKFPTDYQEVLALPGIGRYTAGAILSIADQQRLPILEGNTQRVFSRLIASQAPVAERQTQRLLWRFAEAMLPRTEPGIFNQAAMELGALICRPKSPKCDECPIQSLCEARKLGLQSEIPGKVKKMLYEDRQEYAFVIAEKTSGCSEFPQRYLIRRLPKGVRWEGLWDFPRTTEQVYESVRAATLGISAELGLKLDVKDPLISLKHAVTRFRITLHVCLSESRDLAGPSARPPKPWQFATLEEMDALPMSVTGRKIANFLRSRAIDD